MGCLTLAPVDDLLLGDGDDRVEVALALPVERYPHGRPREELLQPEHVEPIALRSGIDSNGLSREDRLAPQMR